MPFRSFLTFAFHVLNVTLEDAFRHWHQGFRPLADCPKSPRQLTASQLYVLWTCPQN
jgi:hypothetical protein